MKKFIQIVFCLFLSTIIYAVEFDNFDLESMLNVEVVTASKKSEKISDSPAIVSIITQDDLDNWGVKNLYEALTFLPGITMTETYFGLSTMNFRGVLQTMYNNKNLLMVNGHPTFEKTNGTFYLEQIPLTAIDRIEVIRGPGSSLYGTNAFTGVINVITKKAENLKNNSVYVKGGSFSHIESGFVFGSTVNEMDLLVSGQFKQDDGYDYSGATDEASGGGRLPIDLDYENDYYNLFASLGYKGLDININYFDMEKSKLGLTPELVWGGPNKFNGYYIDLAYTHNVNESFELLTRFRYDSYEREMDIGHFPADAFFGFNADTVLLSDSSQFAVDLQGTWQINDQNSLIGGIVYEKPEADPYLFVFKESGGISPFSAFRTSYEVKDLSYFLQWSFNPTEKTALILGGRYNDNEDISDNKFVPRAGFTYKIAEDSDTVIKILYGEAYRNPDFFEKYVATSGVLWGNSSLEREEIQSIDIGLDTRLGQNHNLRVNLFSLETENLIARRAAVVNPNGAEYHNGKGQEVQGLEVELRGALTDSASYFVNAAAKNGENSADGSDLLNIAEFTANGGITYIMNQFKISTALQYVGDKDYSTSMDGSGSISSYFLTNLRLDYKATDNWTISLIGNNIFDEDYLYPEYVRQNIKALPGGPESSVFLKVTFDYPRG